MKDLFTNLMLAGFGAMVMTKEKADDIVGELIAKGEVSRDEAMTVVESLMEKGKKEKNNILNQIRGEVRKVIEDMGVPAREEYDELKKRIQVLEEKIK